MANKTSGLEIFTISTFTSYYLPTGGKTSVVYDDANLSATETVQLYDNTVVSKTSSTLNGRGQAVYSKYLAGATNWNASSVKYDAMGRKQYQSMPYDAASPPNPLVWTEYAYDALAACESMT